MEIVPLDLIKEILFNLQPEEIISLSMTNIFFKHVGDEERVWKEYIYVSVNRGQKKYSPNIIQIDPGIYKLTWKKIAFTYGDKGKYITLKNIGPEDNTRVIKLLSHLCLYDCDEGIQRFIENKCGICDRMLFENLSLVAIGILTVRYKGTLFKFNFTNFVDSLTKPINQIKSFDVSHCSLYDLINGFEVQVLSGHETGLLFDVSI